MPLTTAQKTTLKTDILANANTVNYGGVDVAINLLPNNSDANFAIAGWYNQQVSPDWTVWRTAVTRKEILQNGFDWTRLDNLSVGKARVWSDIFVDGFINPSKVNVRAGIDAVWVGTAQDLAVRSVVYGHCKRNATRAEKVFASGTGSDASPATMAVEGKLLADDVYAARNLPG